MVLPEAFTGTYGVEHFAKNAEKLHEVTGLGHLDAPPMRLRRTVQTLTRPPTRPPTPGRERQRHDARGRRGARRVRDGWRDRGRQPDRAGLVAAHDEGDAVQHHPRLRPRWSPGRAVPEGPPLAGQGGAGRDGGGHRVPARRPRRELRGQRAESGHVLLLRPAVQAPLAVLRGRRVRCPGLPLCVPPLHGAAPLGATAQEPRGRPPGLLPRFQPLDEPGSSRDAGRDRHVRWAPPCHATHPGARATFAASTVAQRDRRAHRPLRAARRAPPTTRHPLSIPGTGRVLSPIRGAPCWTRARWRARASRSPI